MNNLAPTLNGELIFIRPLSPEDFEALFKAASDPLIWEQHPEKDRYCIEVFRRFFKDSLESKGAIVVIDKLTQKIIGTSRFYGANPATKTIVIGYTFLERKYWGGQYNQELKSLMLNFAFNNFVCVYFHVDEQNHRSRKAMLKIKGQINGKFQKIKPDGTQRTVLIYEIKSSSGL